MSFAVDKLLAGAAPKPWRLVNSLATGFDFDAYLRRIAAVPRTNRYSATCCDKESQVIGEMWECVTAAMFFRHLFKLSIYLSDARAQYMCAFRHDVDREYKIFIQQIESWWRKKLT